MKLIKSVRFFTLFTFVLICSHEVFAQPDSTSGGFFNQALAPAKLLAARHEFNEHNMRGALTLYRELLETDPNNAAALYGTAQCHYNLKKYDLALEYLNKATTIDPNVSGEVNYFYGEIHHRLANLDIAISYFRSYSETKSKMSEDYQIAQEFIRQCEFAKEMMKSPVNVKIENMGDHINTRYDEYTPSITADGTKLVFTSRRSDTKGTSIDEMGDYKFFEDIYYSDYDPAKKEWSQSKGIPGDVNTETYDAVLSVSPDGKQMFIYKNTVNMAGDIYRSQYFPVLDTWNLPEKMPRPINTSYYEGSISLTADGNTLYFISEREGGVGRGDIYMSEKKNGEDWSSPKNLGKIVNTELDEKFVFIHPNGKTLYFASEGHQTMGSYDIFKTELINGSWSIPVNLGYPINTVNEESTFSMTSDNKSLLVAAEYSDTYGERDIYRIDVSAYALISQTGTASSFGQVLCTVTDAEGAPMKGVTVMIYGASSEKLVTEMKTDKLGMARVNIPGNLKYKAEVTKGDLKASSDFELKLKTGTDTVLKVDLQLK